ncbi:MipA/OmpV family protein [Novosphingobium sp.]|uniref:MipA/OmpV family protein n=1 Tax=Novosphingobium sp. TaxID=1874826 RepID=UPI0025CE0B54|nr:MipA/OmpV family protein [Novosphingobium sp.]
MVYYRSALALAAVFLVAGAASAQVPAVPGPPPGMRDDGMDRLTVGFGLGIAPDYEGSDDYKLQPGGIFQGRVAGIDFQMRGLNLYTDVIRDAPGSRTRLVFGPVVQIRPERSGSVRDPRVAALGTRKTAVELGATAGIGFRGAVIPPASLNLDVTVLHDVAGAHRSLVVTPSLSLSSPVSRRSFARIGLSADHVGRGYAASYFAVAPGTILPAYDPAGGGWKSAGVSLLYTHDLGGDARKGLGGFVLINGKRMLGRFADSPIVRDAGNASQVFAVTGLSYAF